MNTLIISATGNSRDAIISVDGEPVKLGRLKGGGRGCAYLTDRSEVELTVTKVSEVSGRFWFLWNMLFFIISCFGIFCGRYDKSGICINYRLRLRLNGQDNVQLQFNRFAEGAPAISGSGTCAAEETENVYYTDYQAKKRFKLLTLTKVLLWLVLVAVIIAVVIKKIIG